ncbi:hypothetical protein [Trinickia dabaoshanensis]|uniref:hypothetical protein n=1 Tax=Trinickia dabaoshanensis TaxID=564714 RepID=UPI001E500DAC|nr:hypothetical protein [Trinickia dabaoshanensis]
MTSAGLESNGADAGARSKRAVAFGAVLAAFFLQASFSTALAQTSGSAATAAPAKKSVCVDAQVQGQRALSYDCLAEQLKAKPVASSGASQSAAEALAKSPSNRLGTFNLSTERNRFGSNWGKSATPQRPAPPVVVSPK